MTVKAEHLIVVDTADVAEHFGQPWPPSEPGFCLLLCEDAGERFTLTFGLEYTKRFADAVERGVIDDDTELPIHMFRDRSEGWPPAVMSARCPACQEVMLLVDGCTAGGLMNAYRYGEEPHWQKDDRALLPRCRD